MPSQVKAEVIAQQLSLPQLSYGPFMLFEVLPWLVIATLLRLMTFFVDPMARILFMIPESLAIVLAFIVMSRRMLRIANGQLDGLSLMDHLLLGTDIFGKVVLLLFTASIAALLAGAGAISPYLLIFGIDGIAYDQVQKLVFVWSGVVAAIVLLMVVNAEKSRSSIFGALKELARRSAWLLPAIVAVALIQTGISYIQELARYLVAAYRSLGSAPRLIEDVVLFFYLFGFAALRLWVVVTVLVMALRASSRRDIRATAGAEG